MRAAGNFPDPSKYRYSLTKHGWQSVFVSSLLSAHALCSKGCFGSRNDILDVFWHGNSSAVSAIPQFTKAQKEPKTSSESES
jgi:hypothetical protein